VRGPHPLFSREGMSQAIDIAGLIRQIPSQYPFVLVDRVLEHDPAGRLLAVKNVTGSEEFFQGHFPQAPVMPGVLLMESLAQAAGLWLLREAPDPAALEVHLVGIDEAKFRKPAVPGEQDRPSIDLACAVQALGARPRRPSESAHAAERRVEELVGDDADGARGGTSTSPRGRKQYRPPRHRISR